jgi:hypothetical protein
MVFSYVKEMKFALFFHRTALFKVSHLAQPAAMAVRAAEPGSKEALRALPCNCHTGGAAPKAEDIAANKVIGARAALCHDDFSARQGVEDV